MDVMDWLLEGDPSIRWQTGNDLLHWPTELVKSQRRRVATDGWGRQLLDLQDGDGRWGNGLYSPKWTSTTYTLLQLRRLGLPSSNEGAIAGCRRLLGDAEWFDGGV